MPDPRPQPPGAATPPPRPRISGSVKLLTGIAAAGADVAESILHPAEAEALEIAGAAITVIGVLILLCTIVRGSADTVDRVFRLLRFIRDRPEPPAPDSPGPVPPATAAGAALSAGDDLTARRAAAPHEFGVSSPRCHRRGSGSRRHPARPAGAAEPARGPGSPGPGAASWERPS